MRNWFFAIVLVGIWTCMVYGDDPIFSGPQKGEKMTPFKVWAFSGSEAGKELNLMGKGQKGPVLIVFVHEITRPAFQLIKPLDLYASKLAKEGLSAHFVWLTKDKNDTEAFLNRAKKSLSLKSPIVVSLDGLEGPGNYGLNRKVTLTILVGKDGKVMNNFALVQPNETDAEKIFAAMAKVTGQSKVPTLQELRGQRGTPAGKQSPELANLMRRMIQKTNDEKTVKKIAEEMSTWAGDNRARHKELQGILQRVLRAGYGTEAAQAEMKKLLEKNKSQP
ncbi:MAG: hypothetical protein AB7P49_19985 [Bdellovibrionales bacterium]